MQSSRFTRVRLELRSLGDFPLIFDLPNILLSMLEDHFATFVQNLNTPDGYFQSMEKIAERVCCTTSFLTPYLPFLCKIIELLVV